MFPENHLNKLKNDALHLSPGDKQRVEIYRVGAKVRYSPPTAVYKDLPFLARGLAGMQKYAVREELFDKNWLRKNTGLDY